MTDQSTFLWEEPPANPSASQDSEKEWLTRVATWPSRFLQLLTESAPAGWSGRTSPGSFPVGQMKRRILRPKNHSRITEKFNALEASLVLSELNSEQKSALEALRKLSKQQILTVSSPGFQNSGMVSPTESLTLNISEYPSDAVASSLSDILETGDLPQRFLAGLADDRGLEGRDWFHNPLWAPGLEAGYGSETFPGLRRATEGEDAEGKTESAVTELVDRVEALDGAWQTASAALATSDGKGQ